MPLDKTVRAPFSTVIRMRYDTAVIEVSVSADDLAALIRTCPSGALTYTRKDGKADEATPDVNTARLWEHGPVEVHGDLRMNGESIGIRAVLCRCGASKHKTFCDHSHRDIGFKATGEPKDGLNTEELSERGGPVEITLAENGPMNIKGNLEIVAGSGKQAACCTDGWFCRCGASANKPFCDGSHNKTGFEAAGS